jgi:hypothetical protein
MSATCEELEIISCCEDFIENGHVDNRTVEDQNDLKQPIVNSSSYNDPMEPCFSIEFDELEDVHTCYNVYARQNGFSIQKSHYRLSKDMSIIWIEYVCSRK